MMMSQGDIVIASVVTLAFSRRAISDMSKNSQRSSCSVKDWVLHADQFSRQILDQ